MSASKVTIEMGLDRSEVKAGLREHSADMGKLRQEAAAAEKVIIGVDGKARDASGKFVTMGKSGIDAFASIGLGALSADRAISKLIAGAYELDAALKRAGERQKELAGDFNSGRAKLGELAGQINNGRNDDAFALSQAKFARDALMKQSEALAFRKNFNDSGAQFVGKTIPGTAADPAAGSRKFEANSAKLAKAMGIEPGTVGDFMGTISGIKQFKSPDEALGVGYSSLAILQGGSGDTAHLAKETKKLMASLFGDDETKSVTDSPDEVATLISAAAEFAPGQESENARAGVRALRDFKSNKAGPLLKEAGITAQDTPLQAVAKLKPVVEAKAKAQGVKPMDVLSASVEDITGATALAGYMNKGIDGGIFADRMGKAGGTAGALDRIAMFEAGSDGINAATQADQEYAETQLGAQNAAIDLARKAARAKLTASGYLDSPLAEFKDKFSGIIPGMDLGSKDLMVDMEARDILRKSLPPGATAGLAAKQLAGRDDMGNYSTERTEELRDLINQVNGSGGNALQSLVEELRKQNSELEKQTAIMQKAAPEPRPLNPAPAVQRRQ